MHYTSLASGDRPLCRILEHHGITDGHPWDLLLADTIELPEQALASVAAAEGRTITVAPGFRLLSHKMLMWFTVKAALGRAGAEALMPRSYLADTEGDANLLRERHRPGTMYILKDPRQQQRTGLRLGDDPDDACSGPDDGYHLVQELVPDARLIGNRRFNARLWVTLVRDAEALTAWLHNGSRLVYAPEPWATPPSHDAAISRSNGPPPPGLPRSLSLTDHMEAGDALAELLEPILDGMAGMKAGAVRSLQLFGVDMIFRDDAPPLVLEANRAPDMSGRDAADTRMKDLVLTDMLRLGGLVPGNPQVTRLGSRPF